MKGPRELNRLVLLFSGQSWDAHSCLRIGTPCPAGSWPCAPSLPQAAGWRPDPSAQEPRTEAICASNTRLNPPWILKVDSGSRSSCPPGQPASPLRCPLPPARALRQQPQAESDIPRLHKLFKHLVQLKQRFDF